MSRPIAYDVTHLVCRMAARALTGIDRIDLAYGRHLAATHNGDLLAAFCGTPGPRLMRTTTLSKIVRQAQDSSGETASLEADVNFAQVRNWLEEKESGGETARERTSPLPGIANSLAAEFWRMRCRLARATRAVPHRGIYLNIAEHWLEHHQYFDWLDSRPDVQAVFFVHDLLPLDYPEYFRPGYDVIFKRRFGTIATRGTAFIVSTNVVRDRLRHALAATGRPQSPIHVAPLPSPLAIAEGNATDLKPPSHPYFLMVSTLEPRKNHLLVLNIWRELAALFGADTPRLVLIGSRGWENEQIVDMLDRCENIAKFVFRSAKISRQGLAWLTRHAQALLMPSFDEGYGLPLVEALSMGTPVIASDVETFREVAQGCAILLSPIGGVAWQEAIMNLSKRASPAWQMAKAKVAQFCPPDWDSYFREVDAFLNALR